MKKTILTSILLASFASATEETNIQTQEVVEQTSTELQDLGRGYARDAKSNQIYYDEKLVNVYSPKTFKIINEQNEKGYDAEDYYAYFKQGEEDYYPDRPKIVEPIYGTNYQPFDPELNIPLKCFDDKDNPEDLFQCYQRVIVSDIWSKGTPLNPETFTVIPQLIKGAFSVTDGERKRTIFLLESEHRSFSIEGIDDFSSFQFIGVQTDIVLLSARRDDFMAQKTMKMEYSKWRSGDGLTNFYFKDKSYVYVSGLGKITGADPNTFELLAFPYAKDKSHIFYQGKILAEANRDEFELLDYRLRIARDKTKIFYKDRILKDFDLESFKLISSPFPDLSKYKDPFGRGIIFDIPVCSVALLMDKAQVYYIDVLLLEEPEYPILLFKGRYSKFDDPYAPERLHGMVSIPLPANHLSISKLAANTYNCRHASSIDFLIQDSVFRIERRNSINLNRKESLIKVIEVREEDIQILY